MRAVKGGLRSQTTRQAKREMVLCVMGVSSPSWPPAIVSVTTKSMGLSVERPIYKTTGINQYHTMLLYAFSWSLVSILAIIQRILFWISGKDQAAVCECVRVCGKNAQSAETRRTSSQKVHPAAGFYISAFLKRFQVSIFYPKNNISGLFLCRPHSSALKKCPNSPQAEKAVLKISISFFHFLLFHVKTVLKSVFLNGFPFSALFLFICCFAQTHGHNTRLNVKHMSAALTFLWSSSPCCTFRLMLLTEQLTVHMQVTWALWWCVRSRKGTYNKMCRRRETTA